MLDRGGSCFSSANAVAVFLTLTYALGGAPKRPADNFDFGAKQSGP